MTNGARYFLTNSCGIFVTDCRPGKVFQSVTINLMQIKVEHCGVYAKVCDILRLAGKAD